LPASLQPGPRIGELRFVQDPEQCRDCTIGAWPIGFKHGSSRVIDGDLESGRVRRLPNDVRGCRVRPPVSVCDCERPDRLSELAESGGVRGRNRDVWFHESLLAEPRLSLLLGSEPVPFPGEVVVVGVDEPLEQLEPSRSLGPPTGLDLFADPSLLALIHVIWRPSSDQHNVNDGQTL
jgi:hypothetical protein